MSSFNRTRPIGEILLARGQIRKYQLDFILELQSAYKTRQRIIPLGELLIEHRALTTHALEEALKAQADSPLESITQILKNYEDQISKLTRLDGAPLTDG